MISINTPEAKKASKNTAADFVAIAARLFADDAAKQKILAGYVAAMMRMYEPSRKLSTAARAHWSSAKYGKVSASAVFRAWEQLPEDLTPGTMENAIQYAKANWSKYKAVQCGAIGYYCAMNETEDTLDYIEEALRD